MMNPFSRIEVHESMIRVMFTCAEPISTIQIARGSPSTNLTACRQSTDVRSGEEWVAEGQRSAD